MACKKETSGDVIDRQYVIVGWCGQLHLPKAVCGQQKEKRKKKKDDEMSSCDSRHR